MSDPNKSPVQEGQEQDDRDAALTLKGGMSLPSFGWAKGAPEYLGEVRNEFQKISWPTRQQVAVETGVVILVTVFLTLLITALDWIFALISNRFLV